MRKVELIVIYVSLFVSYMLVYWIICSNKCVVIEKVRSLLVDNYLMLFKYRRVVSYRR